jgi:alkylhydroperoxidase family enzyme
VASDRLRRLADAASALRDGVLNSNAATPSDLRLAAITGDAVPEPWRAFVTTVREHAYRIGDADVAALRSAGFSDDEIFELTVAAALGAATQRLDAGLRAVGRP